MFKSLASLLIIFSALIVEPAYSGCLGGISVAVGTLGFCQPDNSSVGGEYFATFLLS